MPQSLSLNGKDCMSFVKSIIVTIFSCVGPILNLFALSNANWIKLYYPWFILKVYIKSFWWFSHIVYSSVNMYNVFFTPSRHVKPPWGISNLKFGAYWVIKSCAYSFFWNLHYPSPRYICIHEKLKEEVMKYATSMTVSMKESSISIMFKKSNKIWGLEALVSTHNKK